MGGVSMEWKEVRLGDVCTRVCSGGTPKSTNLSYYGGEIPWLNTKEIDFNRIYSTEKTITDSGLNNSSAKWIVPNTVTVAMYGATAGKSCIVKVPMTTNQACCNLTINDEVADYEFVYYSLKNDYTTLASLANGGAQQNLNAQIIKDYVLKMPSLADQRRITSILSSLDRKIELNNKINADLEEMAQAIFKNWFVDFEPFKDGKFVDSELGMIPEGWKVISLSEIMKYNGGSQPPASEFIDTYQEGYIRFIQIRDYDNDSHITYIPISKRNKLCDELDIMIARYGAALGRICWGLKGAYNVALAKVIPIKSYYREYLRCYLNTSYFYQSINNKGARCAQSGFNQSDINSYMIAFPIDETVVMNFNDLCSSIMDKRLSLKYENSRLSTLRDTLLPRLMSGELEVPE